MLLCTASFFITFHHFCFSFEQYFYTLLPFTVPAVFSISGTVVYVMQALY